MYTNRPGSASASRTAFVVPARTVELLARRKDAMGSAVCNFAPGKRLTAAAAVIAFCVSSAVDCLLFQVAPVVLTAANLIKRLFTFFVVFVVDSWLLLECRSFSFSEFRNVRLARLQSARHAIRVLIAVVVVKRNLPAANTAAWTLRLLLLPGAANRLTYIRVIRRTRRSRQGERGWKNRAQQYSANQQSLYSHRAAKPHTELLGRNRPSRI